MCPACKDKRLHDVSDWSHHPFAGHGFTKGVGWSHPDLDPAQHKLVAADVCTGNILGEVAGAGAAAAGVD